MDSHHSKLPTSASHRLITLFLGPVLILSVAVGVTGILPGSVPAARATVSDGFIKNPGLWPDSVAYLSNGTGASVYFTPGAVVIDLRAQPETKSIVDHSDFGGIQFDDAGLPVLGEPGPLDKDGSTGDGCVLFIRFVGANPNPQIAGKDELPARYHYYLGDDPEQWHKDVPVFSQVVYRNLWPGIDLFYRVIGNQLTYSLVMTTRADMSLARFQYLGADLVTEFQPGRFLIETSVGNLVDRRPESGEKRGWLTFPGGAVPGGGGESSMMYWSTLIGGGASLNRVQLDTYPSGDLLVAGSTGSSFANLVPGSYNELPAGPSLAFVARLDKSGDFLHWATFLGGEQDEYIQGLRLDSSEMAVLTGVTGSTDFPVTNLLNGQPDPDTGCVFVTRLRIGGKVQWSTLLGKGAGESVVADPAGNVFVTGRTTDPAFPTTSGAFDEVYNSGPYGADLFLAKVNPTGSELLWSTFLGSPMLDMVSGVDLDPSGHPVVFGVAFSPDFPVTSGAFSETVSGGGDTFVAKFDTDGSRLLWSTFLGGLAGDFPRDVVFDQDGHLVLVGYTESPDFPTTENAFSRELAGEDNGFGSDVFLTKLDRDGDHLHWSTYLGGARIDASSAVVVDQAGNLIVSGFTGSNDFPITEGPSAYGDEGRLDAFVAKFDPTGSDLLYSRVIGGFEDELGQGLVLDSNGNPVLAGLTWSQDFPTTEEAHDGSASGGCDVFVTKLNLFGLPAGGNLPREAVETFPTLHNSPNPFNPQTTIHYELPAAGQVDLKIYDLAGVLVRVLVDRQHKAAGEQQEFWDGRNENGRQVPSGCYLYLLQAGGRTAAKRMLLVK